MNRFILTAILLFSLFSCNQAPSQPILTKQTKVEKGVNADLKPKFTSGVCVIFQDSKANYWFGSRQEGVGLFDGKSFKYFTTKEGLPNNQIRSIKEDENGNILFSTARGVCVYKEGKIIQSIPIVNDAQNDWKKTATDFWFNAGNTEGVYRYDGQQLNYLAFPNPKVINPNNVYFVTCLSEGKNNWIWIGTYAGVFGYNGEQFTIINDDNLKLINESGALHIRSILEDSKGRLWIGNNGIGVLLKEGDELINFSEKHKLIHPSSSRSGGPSMAGTLEHVFAIEEDKDGNIWFADRDTGIWKYDGQSISNFTTEKGLSNYFAFAIYKDKRDDLWFGLEDGQIFKLNGELFERQF